MNEKSTMTNEQIEHTIRDYIPQVIHMSMATVHDNKPWVYEVHYVNDDELNLYFVSALSTRHVQELLENPHVAGNIVTQHFLNQLVRCVEFEGTVEMIQEIEQDHPAMKLYKERFETSGSLLAQIKKDGHIALFKITPSDWYLFDSYDGNRTKYHLPWAQKSQEVK